MSHFLLTMSVVPELKLLTSALARNENSSELIEPGVQLLNVAVLFVMGYIAF